MPCLFLRRRQGVSFYLRKSNEIFLCEEKNKMDATKYAVGYYPAPGDHFKWVRKDHIEKAPQW